jgi:hypothetical protein
VRLRRLRPASWAALAIARRSCRLMKRTEQSRGTIVWWILTPRMAAERMTAGDFLEFRRAESGRFPGSKPVMGKTNKYWRLM